MTSQIADGTMAAPDTGRPRVARYATLEEDYRHLQVGVGLVDRSDRALLLLRGTDRQSWLHNLTTNEVKNLTLGEGNYAYVLNLKGRILFDLNLLVRDDSIWLDLDRCYVELAKSHFDRYTIMEDVQVEDVTDSYIRMGITGEKFKAICNDLGLSQVIALPQLGVIDWSWENTAMTVFRHDFCGVAGMECIVPVDKAVEFWKWLTGSTLSATVEPVGAQAINVRRIEAGIPWPMQEITDNYLPAETGQLERAVSYQKGCYLGQEVVERMRSRNVVAKLLVGLEFERDDGLSEGADLLNESGGTVGVVTSICRNGDGSKTIGLGYVKAASSKPRTILKVKTAGGSIAAEVVELPQKMPAAS